MPELNFQHDYPNAAWLSARTDVFDRLYRFKSRAGLTSWEDTIEWLLATAEVPT